MKKLIIEARMNEYAMRDANANVPWSPAEIAEDAAECREAGASIVHFHGRDRHTGAPAHETGLYAETIQRIREKSDPLVHASLGYVTLQPATLRLKHIIELARNPLTKPDIAPVDMASTNVDIYDAVNKRFKTDDLVFTNPTHILQYFTSELAKLGVKSVHTCWNIGCSRVVDAFLEMGILKGPAWVGLLLSENGLLAAHPGNVQGLQAHLDFLPKNGPVEWVTACYPGSLIPVAAAAIHAGGHLAVGLGDYPYLELGKPRNADVVRYFADLARSLGREVATPEEARNILGMN